MEQYCKGGLPESGELFVEHECGQEVVMPLKGRGMRDKINILGTECSIEFKELKDDGIDGYCDYSSKHIVIRSDNENKIENFEWLQKKQLRHEIIHAFMAESGLQANWQHLEQFGHEETVVDWFAIQSPKIFAVFMELGLAEISTSILTVDVKMDSESICKAISTQIMQEGKLCRDA